MKMDMRSAAVLLGLVLASPALVHGQAPMPLVTGLKNPESVAVGAGGKVYVSVIGEFGKDGDGSIVVLDKDKAVPFVTGLDDPKGLAAYQQWLFVADNKRVLKIDPKGKVEVFAASTAFPTPPLFLNDLTVDPESGTVFVSDSGDLKGNGGAVYSISPKGKVSVVTNKERWPELNTPNGLVLDGASHLLMVDFGSGDLHRIRLEDSSREKIASGFAGADGLAWDRHGRLFISSWKEGKVFVIPRPGAKTIQLDVKFESAADLCLDPTGKFLLIPDMKAGTVTAIPAQVPGEAVDETPMPLETAVAFPDLQWTGWKAETAKGTLYPLRPLVLTHGGDGSNRVFVAIQQGTIHVFPNDQKAKETKIFLNIEDRVAYNDKENEEGLLGLTFHPKFKENGEFFVFYTPKYTPKKSKLINVLSRFKVSKDDPNRADPASEEQLLRIERPFWNHDGGTICFGPDGYLYIALGDGGSANDPFDNAQNLQSPLGKILRIDVNRKDAGLNYAIPKDNPFVGRADARPETWAYGLRNVWRMAFDRKTGDLWAADVGQNLYEEINLITKGGNYGWKRREGVHPFSPKGVGPRADLIEPIWEYHHDTGRSITGGTVYRGTRLPELDGAYLYGDYISSKLWALRYDSAKKRVVANRPIPDRSLPILSFGEDERGEVYMLTASISNRAIYWFARPAATKGAGVGSKSSGK